MAPISNSATVVVNPSDATQAAQANLTSNARPTLADFKTLTDLIEQTISPESWSKTGGSGAIESFPTNLSLVISQTEEVHHQIAELLKQLRKLQDNQVCLEARIVGLLADFFQEVGVDAEKKANSTSPLSAAVQRASRATPQLLNAIRRSVRICSSTGDSVEHPNESMDGRTGVTLANGDAIQIDLAQSLRPEALGWSASREVSMLDKIPYLDWLFKNPSDNPIKRMYLLITPRIIIQEEEAEQKLGIDVTP